ncbi:MAG: CbiX/SirB N-terminal domain-containing protein [Candidatus Hydrogenedentes bacterium]|nr:CbiX/SirB N-terminal domain-containing protein [Candidatus Hydrogenedentota bacterium]
MKTIRLSSLGKTAVVLACAALAASSLTWRVSRAAAQDQSAADSKTAVVLVGHGGPARDFPRLKEYFAKHDEKSPETEQLEADMRDWPRTAENDPYWAGFMKVKHSLEASGRYQSVHAAFNEFCAPTLGAALEQAAAGHPESIIVASIMLTPGGSHSEKDIPKSIDAFKAAHPELKVIYAWPYSEQDIADLIQAQVERFIPAG